MHLKIKLSLIASLFFLLCNVISISETLAALVPVPAGSLASDALTQNFTGVPVGAIAGNAAAFTAINVSNASLIGTFNENSDTLDSGIDGNALVSSGSTLTVQAPDGIMDDMHSGAGFRFELSAPATQFGFMMVDQINHQTEIEIFSSGISLGVVQYNPTGDFPLPFVLFESVQPFDAVEIRTVESESGIGWGLDNITFAGFQETSSIPTMNEWGMIIFLLLAGLGALCYLRRHRKAES